MTAGRKPRGTSHWFRSKKTTWRRHSAWREENGLAPGACMARTYPERRQVQACRPRILHDALVVTALVGGALSCAMPTPPRPPAPDAAQERSDRYDPTLTADFEKRLRDALRSRAPRVEIEGYAVRPTLTLGPPTTAATLDDELWWNPNRGVRYALGGDAASSFIRAMSGYRYGKHDSCGSELRVTVWDGDCRLAVFYIGDEWNGIRWKGQCLGVQGGTANVMLEAALAAFRSTVPGAQKLKRECFELDDGYGILPRLEK